MIPSSEDKFVTYYNTMAHELAFSNLLQVLSCYNVI